jgi:hypothetical protein
LVHDVHPEEEEEDFSTPLIPKTENFLFTFFDLHLGQLTLREPKTSSSNSCPHASHMYSNMGITEL